MSLTPTQIELIRSTVPVLKEHGQAITVSFYDTLLREVPALNNVFNQANQRNQHQAQALAGSLYAYASHIDDLGALSPAVEKICQKHASLYIPPEQYKTVGEYLLRAMGDVLGKALTPEILEAWGAAYWQLANLMIKREDDILQHAEGWTDWREFRIAEKVKESDVITSFYLKPVDGQPLPSFLPGQYISILTDVPKLHYLQSRQYSLSDAPRPDYYRISIKAESGLQSAQPNAEMHPGYVSNIMHDHKSVGDIVKVSHPAGEFFLDPEEKQDDDDNKDPTPIVLISAGVGLTPMVSIVNTLITQANRDERRRRRRRRISFIHGAHTPSVQAFGKHIRAVVNAHPNISSSIFIRSEETETEAEGMHYYRGSRVKLEVLDRERDLFLDDGRTEYFVCGPGGFMSGMRESLVGMGVQEGRVKMEVFGTGELVK